MRIITTVMGSKWLDQDLFDHVNKIWPGYNQIIPNSKNIFFLKNSTVPRLVTDYLGTDIRRVIKKEKAEYCIIAKIQLKPNPQYYDAVNNCISTAETNEVVYPTSHLEPEEISTIEQILWFIENNIPVEYVNELKLNESLNNGFIIDKDNYTTLKELIDSKNQDNIKVAYSMISRANLKENEDWIRYLLIFNGEAFHKELSDASIIVQHFGFANKYKFESYFNSFDLVYKDLNDETVKEMFVQKMHSKFYRMINNYFTGYLGTSLFDLASVELKLKQ
jgi:hypothetical protein